MEQDTACGKQVTPGQSTAARAAALRQEEAKPEAANKRSSDGAKSGK